MTRIYTQDESLLLDEASYVSAYEGNKVEYFSDCPTPNHENIFGSLFDASDDSFLECQF